MCLSLSAFSSAEQEIDLRAFETVGETVYFGHYEQDINLSNGKEPIEWIVLDVQDGRSLLISKYVLDVIPFNERLAEGITWEISTLRKWLNESFILEAFDHNACNLIIRSAVDNSAMQDYGPWSKGGSASTKDYCFLLSYSEYLDYCNNIDGLYHTEASAFSEGKGIAHSGGTSWVLWWLRSPGLKNTAQAGMIGGISSIWSGQNDYDRAGVRPAMWIDLNALLAHPETEESSKKTISLSDPFIWGKEYPQGDLTFSFVQENTLSYYSLRGKDSDTLVNAVSSNAIPGTEKINQKIQEIMLACNYEATEGELDGVRTELYGSEDSDAFVMATYGDWGVNMMLFVDGATGIADYFSGTIKTEDEAQPSSKGSLFGSAMQEANQSTSATKQFNLTAKEYIDAFNKQYGNMGMTLVADSSRDDCLLAIRGEPTDIRIQFCDKINGPWTTGSGLDMKEWNWLYAYIATDDYSVDMLNTHDAKKNLPPEKAQAIRALFNKIQFEQNKRELMDFDKFIETTANIYKEFDKIAPLENYVDMNDFKTKLCVATARDDKETVTALNRELLEIIGGIRF